MDEFVFFKAENSCMYFHVEGFEGAQIKPGKDKILVIFVLEGDVAVDGMQSTTMHWKKYGNQIFDCRDFFKILLHQFSLE